MWWKFLFSVEIYLGPTENKKTKLLFILNNISRNKQLYWISLYKIARRNVNLSHFHCNTFLFLRCDVGIWRETSLKRWMSWFYIIWQIFNMCKYLCTLIIHLFNINLAHNILYFSIYPYLGTQKNSNGNFPCYLCVHKSKTFMEIEHIKCVFKDVSYKIYLRAISIL